MKNYPLDKIMTVHREKLDCCKFICQIHRKASCHCSVRTFEVVDNLEKSLIGLMNLTCTCRNVGIDRHIFIRLKYPQAVMVRNLNWNYMRIALLTTWFSILINCNA